MDCAGAFESLLQPMLHSADESCKAKCQKFVETVPSSSSHMCEIAAADRDGASTWKTLASVACSSKVRNSALGKCSVPSLASADLIVGEVLRELQNLRSDVHRWLKDSKTKTCLDCLLPS